MLAFARRPTTAGHPLRRERNATLEMAREIEFRFEQGNRVWLSASFFANFVTPKLNFPG
jgi:hypothetical protein